MNEETRPERRHPDAGFTFFPDKEEKELIREAPPEYISGLIRVQPTLSAKVLHELWRNRRQEDIYESFRQMPVQDGREACLAVFNDMVGSVAMMRSEFDVSRDTGLSYINDVTTILYKAMKGIPLDGNIPFFRKTPE